MMKKQLISEQVYDYLMEMILSMQIKPSERISEEKIAKQIGCSRAPIREALKRLANDGIVNLYPNRYAEVANYSSEQVEQVGVMRVFHDIMAIRAAMLNGSKADLLNMKTIADECFHAEKIGDRALRIKKDCEFHMEFSRLSKNQPMMKFAKELFTQIEFIQASRYIELVNPQQQLQDHYNVIDYMINNEADKAIELIVKHGSVFFGLSKKYPLSFFIG